MRGWRDELRNLAGNLADEIGEQARRAQRAVQRALDLGPYRLVGYRGYATPSQAMVLGRAFQSRGVGRAVAEAPRWQNLLDTVNRVRTEALPHARVEARLGASARELVADEEGFLHEWMSLDERIRAGSWHEVSLLLEHESLAEPARATAEVLVPDAGAQFGVISDLDDTVLQSHVSSLLRAAQMLLLENARTRLPFPGVAAFYRALARGRSNDQNPIFYVSAGAWNLYDLVVEFLDGQGIPRGPTLLRDWDLGTDFMRTEAHKRAIIADVLESYPTLPFILVGDSGQADPEIYAEVVRANPGRVLAIYIRNVSPAPERAVAIRELAKAVTEAGSTLVLADDTLAAARHAAAHGWIDAASLDEIGGEKREDEGRDPPHGATLIVD